MVSIHRRCSAGALALAGCLLAAIPGSAEPRRATVRAEGNLSSAAVRAAASGAFTPISADGALPARFEVRTGEAPLRLVLPDGTRLDLAPHSAVRRLGPVDVALGPLGKGSADHLSLVAGEVRVEAPATAHIASVLLSSREVLVAPLPGGLVQVRVHEGRTGREPPSLAVGVHRGEARFLSRGAWKPLAAGEAVEAVGGQAAPPPSPLPAPPAWLSRTGACTAADCSLAVAFAKEAASEVPIAWEASDGAASYLLEIARDEAFEEVILRRETTARSARVPLPEGRWFARLFAQGAPRIAGAAGPARALRVSRVSLPPGTLSGERGFLLPFARQIAVADPAGLELALNKSGFLRAPSAFGLVKEAATLARLRVAGAPEYLEIPLDLSPLRADIAISPRNAVWPFEALSVEVRVKHASAGFSPRLVVRIDGADAKVAWERRGEAWTARVEPRVPPGPWVVRVEARDEHDNEIGRGFVEVSGPVTPAARQARR